MSACTQVLNTPELLEFNLGHATPKDLLLWQRVDVSFRDTIRTSSFQRKLFFKASVYKQQGNIDSEEELPRWNPFMGLLSYKAAGAICKNDWVDVKKLQGLSTKHSNGCWREIFLSSPAATESVVYLYDRQGFNLLGGNLKDENGVTIGQLAETLKVGTKIGALCDEGEPLIVLIV